MEAVVSYQDHFAMYHVHHEQESVYNAELIRYYGPQELAPPPQILLIKGVRKWIGNYELPDLLNDLGQVIDTLQPTKEQQPNNI